ncbi:MAG: Rrf2 family transcriptional regulator [Gemmatimonadota bacterium]
MRITAQAEYGLLCTLHLARRGAAFAVSAREVAEREGLPAQYCEKIFHQLRRAHLVESVRGAGGGFRLARPPTTISVKEVIEATEGRTFELNCSEHPVDHERCQTRQTCSLRPIWMALQERIDGLLGGIHLADLLREEAEVRDLVGRSLGSEMEVGAGP